MMTRNTCANCGRPIFKVVTTEKEAGRPVGTSSHMPYEYWTHKSGDLYYTECGLRAEPSRPSVVVEAPSTLSRREIEDFRGRVVNAADAIAESIVAERTVVSAGRK